MTDSERAALFNLWARLQDEIITLSQAEIIMVRMKHPRAELAEVILSEAVNMKRYEADSLQRELDADRVRVI